MSRILIVEDKDSLRTMLEEMLKAEGLRVECAATGTAAVERLRAGERFDLVLTDWRLPGADEHVSVFLPCTPNPTTGFFFYVKRAEIIDLDVKVEDAMTLLISAGMIQPGGGPDQQKKLAAMAQTARAAQAMRTPTAGIP